MINETKTIKINRLPIVTGYTHISPLDYEVVSVFKESKDTIELKRTYIPTKGDRLYIHSGCTIPRFKIKEICDTYSVSMSKSKDNANIWFTNEESTKEDYYSTFRYTDSITKKAILSYLGLVLQKSTANYKEEILKLIKDITNIEADYVLINSNMVYQSYNNGWYNGPKHEFKTEEDLTEYNDDGTELPYDKELIERDTETTFCYFESIEKQTNYNNLLNHTTLYHEKSLISLLNSNLIMDKEMYDGVHNLFQSTDSSNHVLAMESMANCNYLKSAVYLLLLVKDNYTQIYNSPMKNHVNFKTFSNFFGLHFRYSMIDIDKIVSILIGYNILTKANLDMLLPFAEQTVKDTGNTNYFYMSKMVPSKEILDILALEELALQQETLAIEESSSHLTEL